MFNILNAINIQITEMELGKGAAKNGRRVALLRKRKEKDRSEEKEFIEGKSKEK